MREACEALWPDTDIVEFYGSTETSFVSFHSTKNPGPETSVGRIFPGVQIDIRNADGETTSQPGSGEIFATSDMLFDRYVGGEKAGQWVSVGDIGCLDEQNCLHLTGRLNRIINSKGLKIHPEQIEAALATRPEIEAAAVIGMPDSLRGAAAIAVVTFKPSRQTGRAALSAFCRAEFGEGYSPLRFYESDRLPKTSSGKFALSVIAEALATRPEIRAVDLEICNAELMVEIARGVIEGWRDDPPAWHNTALTILEGPPWRTTLLACVAHLDGDEASGGIA